MNALYIEQTTEQPVQEIAGTLSSDATAAILGGIVGGMLALLATIGSQYLQYRLRRAGKVRCGARSLFVGFPEPMAVHFNFLLVFYNEKEVAIGIDDIVLTVWHDGECLIKTPLSALEGESYQPLVYLDLPARQMVPKRVDRKFPVHEDTVKRIRDDEKRTLKLSWTYVTGRRVTRVIPTNIQGRWHNDWWDRVTDRFRRPCEDHEPYEPFIRVD